eukprot:scaffold1139_cov107-Skeletonema_dohrnii-CCMP3373.AAC.3
MDALEDCEVCACRRIAVRDMWVVFGVTMTTLSTKELDLRHWPPILVLPSVQNKVRHRYDTPHFKVSFEFELFHHK